MRMTDDLITQRVMKQIMKEIHRITPDGRNRFHTY